MRADARGVARMLTQSRFCTLPFARSRFDTLQELIVELIDFRYYFHEDKIDTSLTVKNALRCASPVLMK